ncbi:hypothetical protein LX32DRAFT_291703 [Colletotrichum zoysiae]|uniref:Uncharacterized protein n=1 Tax=Colletotrichum zoysiae TaxID=1216348 RepID=A0AAD9LUF6_9PEZI|nr:hypothetical protein LX32DRAFT_291703 [Colletotrichum zoysiae]
MRAHVRWQLPDASVCLSQAPIFLTTGARLSHVQHSQGTKLAPRSQHCRVFAGSHAWLLRNANTRPVRLVGMEEGIHNSSMEKFQDSSASRYVSRLSCFFARPRILSVML